MYRYTNDEINYLNKRNRITAQMPHYGKKWCWGCDRALIGDGNRCKTCGTKDLSQRFKR